MPKPGPTPTPTLTPTPTSNPAQAIATLWLAQQMLPDRLYLEGEIDWVIASRLSRKQVPDCPTVRKEFERYGLVELVRVRARANPNP